MERSMIMKKSLKLSAAVAMAFVAVGSISNSAQALDLSQRMVCRGFENIIDSQTGRNTGSGRSIEVVIDINSSEMVTGQSKGMLFDGSINSLVGSKSTCGVISGNADLEVSAQVGLLKFSRSVGSDNSKQFALVSLDTSGSGRFSCAVGSRQVLVNLDGCSN
jgi:hypothetical protein